MINNIETLLRIFYNHRFLFETLFEKRNQSVQISEIIDDKIDHDRLQFFSESELIVITDGIIELDDRIIEFFEEFLDTSRDIKIGVIDDILDHLVFHISNIKENQNSEKSRSDIKRVRRYLKQIPILILKNIIQLSLHIGLVYKTQDEFKSKVKALQFHQSRLKKLILIKEKVEKLLQLEKNFFKTSYDSEIIILQRELQVKLNDLNISLITLQKDVTMYLNRSLQKVLFWEKVIKLKELRDDFELKEKTNILEVCQKKMPLNFSKTNTLFKTNLSKEILFEEDYFQMVQKLLKSKKLKKPKEKYASKIDDAFLHSTTVKTLSLDTNSLNSEFLSTSYNLFEFILYKNFKIPLDDNEKIELFCKMLLLYEDSYILENRRKVYKNYRYILVYPKG